ncbi:MAG: hypothetical protein ACXW3D_02850 [Caulobacteraceae bacterium]
MDPVYDKAVARLQEIEVERTILKQFVESYRRTRHVLGLDERSVDGTHSEHKSNPQELLPLADTAPAEKRKRVTDNPKPADVVRESLAILRERGRPMTRRDLHTALKERGLEIKGADPIKALGTMLWRGKDQLIQLEGFGYWPKDDVYNPANYDGGL